MSDHRPPRFDGRRRRELRNELVSRARAWLPEWRPRSDNADFATAIFEVAARLSAEVTERLDRVPEKTFRGFLDWLGVRGQAGRAARLPIVFSMAAGAEPMLADAPVQLQALDVDPPVTFETEQPLMVVPGTLSTMVGADPAGDAFYAPPGGFSRLEAPKAVPNEWRVKSAASVGATQLQLEPELGLDELPTLCHAATQQQYRVTKADGGIVSIEPPLGTVESKPDVPAAAAAGLSVDERLTRVSTFAPFGAAERNRQEHALYIGSESVLNLKAEARIQIEGGALIPREVDWAYWGKAAGRDAVDWQPLPKPDPEGPLVLRKPAGDVEIREVEGRKSRWLRGRIPPGAVRDAVSVSQLKLTINCDDDTALHCPREPGDPRSTVAIEAVGNTTPIVLDATFYPLGREPRLFDAFYLASPEAFSKENALVEICFQVSDGTSAAMMAARLGIGSAAPAMVFCVGQDGNLHRLRPEPDLARPVRRLAPVRPPFRENGTASFPAPATSLNAQQPARLTAVSRSQSDSADAVVAVTAKLDAWLWLQTTAPAASRWYRGGTIFDPADGDPPPFNREKPPAVILMRDAAGLRMVGLNEGTLYTAEWPGGPTDRPPTWRRVDPSPPTQGPWLQIVPIFGMHDRLHGADAANGWLAIDAEGLAIFAKDGSLTRVTAIGTIAPEVVPLAIKISEQRMVIVVQQQRPGANGLEGLEPTVVAASGGAAPERREEDVVAWLVTLPDHAAEVVAFNSQVKVIGSFDWHITRETETDLSIVFAAEQVDGSRVLATWRPLTAGSPRARSLPVYSSPEIDLLHGAPAVTDELIIASGPRGEVVAVPFHPDRLRSLSVPRSAIEDAWLIHGAERPFDVGDFVVVSRGEGGEVVAKVTNEPELAGADHFFLPDPPVVGRLDGTAAIFARLVRRDFGGRVVGRKRRQLDLDDLDTAGRGSLIVILVDDEPVSQHEIQSIRSRPNRPRRAVLDRPVPGREFDVRYVHVVQRPSRRFAQLPVLRLTDVPPADIAAIARADLHVEGAIPIQRTLKMHPVAGMPRYAVLARDWTTRPPQQNAIALVPIEVYGEAQTLAESKSVNPELSWEYWDGTAWWTIKGLSDGTGHLLSNGVVKFCVPGTLRPTDVAGRTSHWIRARLVGGDYGRESVTLTSVQDDSDPPVTTQTVNRSLDGIAAPQIVSVDLWYSVCCAAVPEHVLTKDGGSIVDQSEANRTRDAHVELFVPLTETIRRAGAERPRATDTDSGTTARADAAVSARALYLGFDAALKGGPISILFLVDERDHDGAYPLQVDVLHRNRFEPVVSQDGTRGLNESGVVTLTLASPPVRTSLFGESRHWLRLRPNPRFEAAKWGPSIRGAYLNATWARASDTQRIEPLGSSDGSPNQRVFIARPPVLKDSLKLRVWEPLGEEDIADLRLRDPDIVLDRLNERPGPWVLWTEVVDPADEAKDARVYALDDETGEVAFGDGLHGRIPPPHRDSILAERYLRGGGDEANKVKAWSQVNLITPLQGVERVAAPEGAAGGSDPQDASTTMRFAPANLLMRDRALTLRDLEMLAAQFSPEIAQVRAIANGTAVALVVVMRGRDPKPSGAVRRELVRYLLQRAAPMLARRGAFEVIPPSPVGTRVTLRIAIDAIEHSGDVVKEVVRRIAALLDPAAGGFERTGWRLGDAPSELDIAAALGGASHAEAIEAVAIDAVGGDGALRPMPAALRPTELAFLVDDGIRVELSVSSSEAVA